MKLAIVGTAGRKEDYARLNGRIYQQMIEKAKIVMYKLRTERGMPIGCLVSGGAAWADHVAVELFLEGSLLKLELHLPALFDRQAKRFREDGSDDCGKIANFHHERFSRKIGFSSLHRLALAIGLPGCEMIVTTGFKRRNTMVAARSDALLAMTFGIGHCVKNGGTEDTVRKFLERHPQAPTYHMDLNQLLCYPGIKVAA
jgi:hypothetical protein